MPTIHIFFKHVTNKSVDPQQFVVCIYVRVSLIRLTVWSTLLLIDSILFEMKAQVHYNKIALPPWKVPLHTGMEMEHSKIVWNLDVFQVQHDIYSHVSISEQQNIWVNTHYPIKHYLKTIFMVFIWKYNWHKGIFLSFPSCSYFLSNKRTLIFSSIYA